MLLMWIPSSARGAKLAIPGLMFLAICLLFAPRSYASWSTIKSAGTLNAAGNPSCAEVSSHVACAVLNAKGALEVNVFNGSSWGSWTQLTGEVNSNPSCTSDGDGKVFCGATAASGGLLVTIYNGSSWGTPTRLVGGIY
jgi:hypothetical protein